MAGFPNRTVIAAIRTEADFQLALRSAPRIFFLLNSEILTLEGQLREAHDAGKQVFLHLDFADGIGRDQSGIRYLSRLGVDGIISTRTNLIRLARECGLRTVQRFFIVDSHSVATAVESIRSARPDMIEIMPGVLPKIVRSFRETVRVPIIAGGLIETVEDADQAFSAGASAISTARTSLWK